MNIHHNTPLMSGHRARLAQRKCAVPPADGVQAIDLDATSQEAVALGADLAGRWLDSTQSEPLHLHIACLSHGTPPKYWPDLQAGFLARIDQRLRSDIGGQHRSTAAKQAQIALGNATMNRMLGQLQRTAQLFEAGAIVPNSAEGAEQLRALLALVHQITVLGEVRK